MTVYKLIESLCNKVVFDELKDHPEYYSNSCFEGIPNPRDLERISNLKNGNIGSFTIVECVELSDFCRKDMRGKYLSADLTNAHLGSISLTDEKSNKD
jgi:hypothetical protein